MKINGFEKGQRVQIKDVGYMYPSYKQCAKLMGAKNWYLGTLMEEKNFYSNCFGAIVGIRKHPNWHENETHKVYIALVRLESTVLMNMQLEEILVDIDGLTLEDQLTNRGTISLRK